MYITEWFLNARSSTDMWFVHPLSPVGMSKRKFDELTYDEQSELGDETREVIEASLASYPVWTITSKPSLWASINDDTNDTYKRHKQVMKTRSWYLESLSNFIDFFFLFFLPTNQHRFKLGVETEAIYKEIRYEIYTKNVLFLLNPSTFYHSSRINVPFAGQCNICYLVLRRKLQARLQDIEKTTNGPGIIDLAVYTHDCDLEVVRPILCCMHCTHPVEEPCTGPPTCEICFCEHCRTVGDPDESTLSLSCYPEEQYYTMDGWEFGQVRDDIEESTGVAKVSCTIIMGYLIPPHLHDSLLKRQ